MTIPTDTKVSGSPSVPPPAIAEEAVKKVQWLADEHVGAESKEQQALLSYESGLLRETAHDEAGAARDLLAAYNADGNFREPVETLASLLERRKSYKNLGRMIEALIKSASSPEQAARVQMQKGQYALEHQNDVEAARAAWEQAVVEDEDAAAAWLELELLAGKHNDPDARLRSLQQRTRLAQPLEWKALLQIDLAKLVQADNIDGALEALQEAAEMQGPARFRAWRVIEAIARRDGRDVLVADAMEAQARLIVDALDDEPSGEAAGVPQYMRSSERVADLYLRASEAKRRAGESEDALKLLDKAIEQLPGNRMLAYVRLKAAENAGDIDTAATLSRKLLDGGVQGRAAAPLWMRVFEAAAAKGERDRALEALTSALAADPGCIPARALQIDLLVDGDAAQFAAALEAMAAEGLSDPAKGRTYLVSAWAWALRARDVSGAKAALTQAAMFGVEPGVIARLARAMAAVVEDEAWYEEATRRLLSNGAAPGEHVSLWWELGRTRLLRGDRDGAAKAFDALATNEGSAWLGRVLGAYALGLVKAEKTEGEQSPAAARSPAFMEQLAEVEPDPGMARSLKVVAAVQTARAGDREGAAQRLRALHEKDNTDLFVGMILADIERALGRPVQAATVLSACAAGVEDGEMFTALRLEAAFLLWRAGERVRAFEELGAARENHPDIAASVLLWAAAALDPSTVQGRRRVLELAGDQPADKIACAIERFAVESCEGGDLEAVRGALDVLDQDALGELGVAGWLGRLVYAGAVEDREARNRALDSIEALGVKASAVVAAERYRIARVEEQDLSAAREHAKKWATTDGGVASAIEWVAASRASDDADEEAQGRRLAARGLTGAACEAVGASAAMIELLRAPSTRHPVLLDGSQPATALLNLELAPAGCDPRRRAMALKGVGQSLGEAASLDALALAGWSLLASGDGQGALELFRQVVDKRPTDIASWEGVRTAAEVVDDVKGMAGACEKLGALCADDVRAAKFLETAGLVWIDIGGDPERGERALHAAFKRDAKRDVAFDRLFRRVRARDDNELLLQLISRRLDVAELTAEIAKLFWEQARVLRQKGDFEGAMSALENVVMLEPDHVGALALTGEVAIRGGDFKTAVDNLARLAAHPEAPNQQRLVSGMAAVDLCENKLNDSKRALEILLTMHKSGLSTVQLRERLAKAAAQNQAWPEATSVLETLMNERKESAGRMEAARVAMAIYRDKISDPSAADRAVAKLLDEAPADAEGLDLVLKHDDVGDAQWRTKAFERARRTLVSALSRGEQDAAKVELLARIAKNTRDNSLRQATLGALITLERGSIEELSRELQGLDARVARTPQVAIDDDAVAAICDPRDSGPIPMLLRMCSEVTVEALGPTLAGLGVTKKDRSDARDGHPLRNEIAHWAGALGIGEFDLYIGGREPKAVHGVPGDPPFLVVGSGIGTPMDAVSRQAVARELFALRRGISIVRTRDDATVACVVVALCKEAEVALPSPPFAMLAETQRLISKAMSRKVRKTIGEVCQAASASGVPPRDWVSFALSSLDRMAVIAAGDVSLVLADVLSAPRDKLGALVTDKERARSLIAFVLGDRYLELRRQLGMGVQ
jgi:cellulose synthase operon protein C